jgi:hypothetical protein
MSDIQAIIDLIEKGHSNSDHRDGQKQINEAVSVLRRMQEDSHLNSGQRWELSQILECGPLYVDIERAVKGMKETKELGHTKTEPYRSVYRHVLVHGKVEFGMVDVPEFYV